MSKARVLTALLMLSALLPFLTGGAPCQSTHPDRFSSREINSSVGPFRIGLNFTVRNDIELLKAHYFYASDLVDIPLTGTVSGEQVQFKGQDGSLFQLHFVGNGSNGTNPLTFYNSIGLIGTWTLGPGQSSRTVPVISPLPVKLIGGYGTANPGERLYAGVTAEPDHTFEEMVQAFRRSALAGDRTAIAHYLHFPLWIKSATGHSFLIRNPTQLRTRWSQIFTPAMIERLRNAIPHEMFVHDGQAMLGEGEFWFDEHGLTSVNVLPEASPRTDATIAARINSK